MGLDANYAAVTMNDPSLPPYGITKDRASRYLLGPNSTPAGR
jgi:hypothetical protein